MEKMEFVKGVTLLVRPVMVQVKMIVFLVLIMPISTIIPAI
jgi:hypothetical protein